MGDIIPCGAVVGAMVIGAAVEEACNNPGGPPGIVIGASDVA